MEKVTLYKIIRYAAPGKEEEQSYSLTPWELGEEGEDDGGRGYLLPEGYALAERDGIPVVVDRDGVSCGIQTYNGLPVLVDLTKKQAILLEIEKKLLKHREAAGLTRAELASYLGITQKELYEIENGEKEATTGFFRRAAEFLGCDWLELI